MDPVGSAVLAEMRDNIEEIKLPDGSVKYNVQYVTYDKLKYIFWPDLSNYQEAAKQAKTNFQKIIKQGGLSAIQEMMSRGQTDKHFRILSATETEKVLAQSHCFSFQTTAFKEASKSTKIRHVSNPSICVGNNQVILPTHLIGHWQHSHCTPTFYRLILNQPIENYLYILTTENISISVV